MSWRSRLCQEASVSAGARVARATALRYFLITKCRLGRPPETSHSVHQGLTLSPSPLVPVKATCAVILLMLGSLYHTALASGCLGLFRMSGTICSCDLVGSVSATGLEVVPGGQWQCGTRGRGTLHPWSSGHAETESAWCSSVLAVCTVSAVVCGCRP